MGRVISRRHAGAGGVECQLADRNAHAADAQVAQAEDALAVGDDDEAHVRLAASCDSSSRKRPFAVIGRYMPREAAEDVVELLAGLADRRRVDQRHEGRRVRHQHRVEQHFVARLQSLRNRYLLQIAVDFGELRVNPRDLDLERVDGGRQQPLDPQ